MNGNESPKILITRLSHIGDCILTMPMLTALRRAYPRAFIAWAVEKPTHQLLGNHPDLDEIILVPKGWMGAPRHWRGLVRELRSFKFDIAIDPQGITKSAALGFLAGAKQRIGIQGRWGRELSGVLNNRLVETQQLHLVDRSIELLSALGIEETTPQFNFRTSRKSDQDMGEFLWANEIQTPYVVLNPGGTWESKRWENDRFAEVAIHMYRQFGISSIVSWAGDEELEMAHAISRHASDVPGAVSIAPKTSLNELASLLKRAAFFIGGDTGPMHISTAVGTPCIGLHGTTRPVDSGAYGPQNIYVQNRYHSGTSRERRSADNSAMREISVLDVCNAADQMIATQINGVVAAA